QILVWPILNLLILLYKGFASLGIPGPLGWAIIGMTFIVRGIIHPLNHRQMDTMRKMQELKPHIENLQKKYKNDKQKLQQEQLKLYQQHGINPAAGCLPLLIQMPIVYGLFQTFSAILQAESNQQALDTINKLVYHPFLHIDSLNTTFFGVNLTIFPNQWQEYGIWLLAIPVITGVLTWYQSKVMTAMQQPQNQIEKPKTKKDEKKPEDMAQEMQKQMMYIMPVMIGFFAYSFPIGLSLYWNTLTLFMIVSQKHFRRPHGTPNKGQIAV
ncbi:MAG: membrane protein insertase, yidc/oxa1 family, preprotein translocase subunit YidC, partial [Microgenomates group bacterium GW2011_GWC1_41_8]